MKEHHRHPNFDPGLGGLLARCGHTFAHRIGDRKRGQDGILTIIAQQPGITQKELGEKLGIQPASVSELLMKLERKGLVAREKSEQDRRSIQVQLTEAGRQLLDASAEDHSDPFQALSPQEQAQLRSLLGKLLTDWEQRYPTEHHRHKHHHHDKENHNGKHE